MNVIFPESESVPFVPLEHFVMNACLFSYVFTYPYVQGVSKKKSV